MLQILGGSHRPFRVLDAHKRLWAVTLSPAADGGERIRGQGRPCPSVGFGQPERLRSVQGELHCRGFARDYATHWSLVKLIRVARPIVPLFFTAPASTACCGSGPSRPATPSPPARPAPHARPRAAPPPRW